MPAISEAGRCPLSVVEYAGLVSTVLAASRPDLVGVYLHGSAVLGGFQPGRSDVDVLAVVERPGTVDAQRAMGEAVAASARSCPGAGLELSVITVTTAATIGCGPVAASAANRLRPQSDGLAACPFEVHVNTTAPDAAIVTGADHPGDPDLVLHCAVCRDHARAVTGPPPDRVFGPVPAERVLAAMTADLRWAIDQGHIGYAVLNACRALRYAESGLLCSKRDGADWYLARHPGDPVVLAARDHARSGDPVPVAEGATRFLEQTRRHLLAASVRRT
ncbi:aminoglycoside adenylyltransferase domain-containing protein [Rugosimonospora africana]|uniref:Streptomycin 3''-adenylyltransferase n=1 Tax=Rugosimonospora africana TaxID=556532 RepID=A0A8J3QQF1_9ACTN|nr:aminoglycoside adenylyltransferase domain-containing protein [Rugosimonospora africana]GIH14402.1 streptomycin 3''-adenylyltransferase [Rugosimonospora africana]